MSIYRHVKTRVWRDEKVRRLSPLCPSGQSLFIYLLTCPETCMIPGIIPVGKEALREALGWDAKGFAKGFAEVFREGLAEADWDARLIWLPNAVKHNPPPNPNVVKGWSKVWVELPECDLLTRAHARLYADLKGLGKGFAKAFEDTFPNPSLNPLPKQEQEQEQESSSLTENSVGLKPDAGGGGKKADQKADPIRQVVEHYRTHHPRSRVASKSTDKEWKLIRDRLEVYSVEDLIRAIDGYHVSPHHTGENERKTKYLGLELIMRDATHVENGWRYLDENGGKVSKEEWSRLCDKKCLTCVRGVKQVNGEGVMCHCVQWALDDIEKAKAQEVL